MLGSVASARWSVTVDSIEVAGPTACSGSAHLRRAVLAMLEPVRLVQTAVLPAAGTSGL
jgi:hypothetical protein